jgi:hypothetical protein
VLRTPRFTVSEELIENPMAGAQLVSIYHGSKVPIIGKLVGEGESTGSDTRLDALKALAGAAKVQRGRVVSTVGR